MRLLMLMALLLAVMASGCNGTKESEAWLEYQRSGGFAALEDRLTIYENGGAILVSHGQKVEFSLSLSSLDELRRLFEEADFAQLDQEYRPQDSGADLITHEISYQGHRVLAQDGAIPESLGPILEVLQRIIADNP
jgi:hypothetical protein